MVALVEAVDLADFPGAPFSDVVVEAASESVRGDARWHIAPSLTETLTVDSDGGYVLLLQTLQLTAVTEVRDISGDDPVVLDGWRSAPTTRFRSGVLIRDRRWPCGPIEVDVTHGYATCPADLLPAIAFRCQRAKVDASTGSVRLGSLSIAPSGVPNTAVAEAAQPDAAVSRYRIPGSR